MDVHQRQQFDTLLGDAGEAFVERIVQRCAGQDNALAALSRDRNADGVWLDEFVDAVFADGCLDNAEGAGWVLGALKTRPLDVAALALPAGGSGAPATVEQVLVTLAKSAFGDLLHAKVLEAMNRASVYG
jgi:hypothetical protein